MALHIAAYEDLVNIIRILLTHGAQIDAPKHGGGSDIGMTALHIATSRGHKETVRLLVDHGANINVLDYNGCTPVDIAWFHDGKEIESILRAAGGKRGDELDAKP